MRMMCGIVPQLCQSSLYLISDEDTSLLDESRSQVYFGHYPSGTSLRTIDHYAQIMNEKEMKRYNFGDDEINMKMYGQKVPPTI